VLSALPNPVELVPLMGDAYAASYVSSDLEAVYRQNLTEQITRFGLAETALRVAAGRPDVALPDLVKTEHIDCLIIGTVCRKGLAAFWLGNTAEEVMPRVDCDLLLLRPQDYFDPH
jgi:nucleotide-binding universal stress UspA family protein